MEVSPAAGSHPWKREEGRDKGRDMIFARGESLPVYLGWGFYIARGRVSRRDTHSFAERRISAQEDLTFRRSLRAAVPPRWANSLPDSYDPSFTTPRSGWANLHNILFFKDRDDIFWRSLRTADLFFFGCRRHEIGTQVSRFFEPPLTMFNKKKLRREGPNSRDPSFTTPAIKGTLLIRPPTRDEYKKKGIQDFLSKKKKTILSGDRYVLIIDYVLILRRESPTCEAFWFHFQLYFGWPDIHAAVATILFLGVGSPNRVGARKGRNPDFRGERGADPPPPPRRRVWERAQVRSGFFR